MAPTTSQTSKHLIRFTRYIPILSWLPRYDRAWLSLDVIAGLTLWGLVVPEAIAYAGIAGLPPEAGLYTLLAALLVYAIFGTSRHLVVQATSATAALLASAVAAALVATAAATASDPEAYQTYAAAFVLVTGLVFLAAGLARLGFITQFLSIPVMDGFVTGLAIFVAVGQLNKLFGVAKPEGNTVEKLLGIIQELPQANWVTFAVGAAALALLFLLPRWNKKIPAGLVVLFASIGLSAALDLQGNYGVAVVGALPQGLPSARRESSRAPTTAVSRSWRLCGESRTPPGPSSPRWIRTRFTVPSRHEASISWPWSRSSSTRWSGSSCCRSGWSASRSAACWNCCGPL